MNKEKRNQKSIREIRAQINDPIPGNLYNPKDRLLEWLMAITWAILFSLFI
ncbi:hypothetical protein QQ020_13035 [Fulvivirgaceae bacterium BMA12]|uniref:Uncharacterized protein n=1 Tax=Agaribacillus aureus TaxID=3051825 RepID=A0ABT8L5I2_9BACT|nr:hypothetical protein [Fulvivirgaceae bacterium BMA12]